MPTKQQGACRLPPRRVFAWLVCMLALTSCTRSKDGPYYKKLEGPPASVILDLDSVESYMGTGPGITFRVDKKDAQEITNLLSASFSVINDSKLFIKMVDHGSLTLRYQGGAERELEILSLDGTCYLSAKDFTLQFPVDTKNVRQTLEAVHQKTKQRTE